MGDLVLFLWEKDGGLEVYEAVESGNSNLISGMHDLGGFYKLYKFYWAPIILMCFEN